MEYLSYPHAERCVVLLGRRTLDAYVVLLIFPVPNVHPDPVEHYSVDGRSFRRAMVVGAERGFYPLGILHTHLAQHPPTPSDDDADGLPEDMVGGVYHVVDQTVCWFWP